MKNRLNHALFGVLLSVTVSAQAATVASSLPYKGTPDWTDIVFTGTSMTSNGSISTLTTANNVGVWFGWGATYSDPAPNWTPGTPAQGNYFNMSASFSSGATDWSAYLLDTTHEAAMIFNDTGCNGNAGSCYGINLGAAQQGVTVYHAEVSGSTSTFVSLDLTQTHSFEFLLKNGQVAYRVDGQVIFAGAAFSVPYGNPLLVVGDGSATTLTGRGSMTIHGVGFDNAPTLNTLVTTVPEPETYALMLAGLGLVGFAARHRKA
jgi:hypothetical protein